MTVKLSPHPTQRELVTLSLLLTNHKPKGHSHDR